MHQPSSELDKRYKLVVNETSSRPITDVQYDSNNYHASIKPSKDILLHDEVQLPRKHNKSRKNIKTSPYHIAHKRVKTDESSEHCINNSLNDQKLVAEELGIQLREPVQDTAQEEPEAGLFVKEKLHISDNYEKGNVIYGTSSAIIKMLHDKVSLTDVCQGVIKDTSGDIRISSKKTYRLDCDYRDIKLLGSGSNGVVNLISDVQSNKHFVLKQMKRTLFTSKEVQVMLQLNHKNITQCLGVIVDGDFINLLQSYSGVCLETLVRRENVRFTEDEIIHLSIQALSGLSFMHIYSILHMDIKPGNICVKRETMTLYLTDFGSTFTPQQPLEFNGLTPEYMSPELCQRYMNKMFEQHNIDLRYMEAEMPSGKNDVYSWGLTMCFLLQGDHVMLKYMTNDPVEFTRSRRLFPQQIAMNPDFMASVIDDTINCDLRVIIKQLLSGNIKDRYTAEEGKKHLEEIQHRREKSKQPKAEFIGKLDVRDNIKKKLKEKLQSGQTVHAPVQERTTPIYLPIEQTANIPNFDSLGLL